MINLDGYTIDSNSDCYVIAEIGHNHGGDLEKCKRLFQAAMLSGANAVKLQKRDNRTLYTKALYNQPYDNPDSYGKTYGEHREALEFNKYQYLELQNFCRKIGITLFATAFDIPSADILESLDMPFYKIASACLTDIPLIKHIGSFKKPVIMSTASVIKDDIDRAVNALGHSDFALLHCVAKYQNIQPNDLQLAHIANLKADYPNIPIGYSSHYSGYWDAVRAIETYDIKIIEKHFTLRHEDKGTDHKFSLEPQGMKALTDYIKNRHAFDGGINRVRLEDEVKPLAKMGKSIHVIKPIASGEVFTPENVAVKSPDDGGLPPVCFENLIGLKSKTDLSTAMTLTKEAV